MPEGRKGAETAIKPGTESTDAQELPNSETGIMTRRRDSKVLSRPLTTVGGRESLCAEVSPSFLRRGSLSAQRFLRLSLGERRSLRRRSFLPKVYPEVRYVHPEVYPKVRYVHPEYTTLCICLPVSLRCVASLCTYGV